MTVEFVIFLGVGKLVIYTLQKFLSDNVSNKFVNNLVSCDLCLGVWIYTALATIYRINILTDVFPYIPVLSQLIIGCVASFVMHLLSLGWREKFSVIVI